MSSLQADFVSQEHCPLVFYSMWWSEALRARDIRWGEVRFLWRMLGTITRSSLNSAVV